MSTLVEALRRLGADEGASPQKPLWGDLTSLGGGQAALYRLLRDGLAHFEREARRHAEFVDRLTAAKAPPKSAVSSAVQQTLYLQGAAGTRTAGRFRAVNRRAARVAVATLSRPFTQDGEPVRDGPALALRPGAFYLAPEEARLVTVEADLTAPGRYETCVDLTMDDAVTLKLWIDIDVYA